MKRLLRSLWFLYGVTIFFILVILCFPFYIIAFIVFREKVVRPLIRFSHHVVARLSLLSMLIRPKIHNLKNIDNQKIYVVVSNHQAAIDILLSASVLPFPFKFLSKKEMTKIPLFGYIAGKFSVLVDRKNPASRKESFNNMKKALADGFPVFIAPEGTRNRTQEMLTKFYDGAFRLAIETNTPLLVQTLAHPRKLNNPNRTLDMSPGTVHCYLSTPIETSNFTMDDMPALKKQVRQIMLSNLQKH